jgi:hypothetical protein
VGTRGELVQGQHAEASPARASADPRLDDGDRDRPAGHRQRAALLAVEDDDPHLSTRRPLHEGDRRLLALAAQRRPLRLDDHVAALDAGVLRRRVVEHLEHAQPARVGADGHADARVLAVLRGAEAAVLGGIEIVREAVVEPAHHPGDRVVGELVLGDLAVVALVHAVDRLAHGAGALVSDQRVAHEPGQRSGMRAEPDAGEQDEDGQQAGDRAPHAQQAR